MLGEMINLWTANLPKNQIEQKALVYNFGKLTISPSIRLDRLLIHSQPPFKKANQSADVSKKAATILLQLYQPKTF